MKDWKTELKVRLRMIDQKYSKESDLDYQKRKDSIEQRLKELSNTPVVKYDLVIRDFENRVIKTLGWGLSLKDCITLSKKYETSRLIRESEGLYSLHYLKVEKGLYRE